jgi:hypothetical protein
VAVTALGHPYVAWQDAGGGPDQIYVRSWGAEAWREIGQNSASAGGISDTTGGSGAPSLAIRSSTTYVAWHDASSGARQIYARRWNGAFWVEVGQGSAGGGGISGTDGDADGPSATVAPDGTLYIAWHDTADGDGEIYVRRWDGADWIQVGAGSAGGGGVSDNAGQSRDAALVIAPDGTPYVFWSDDSSGRYEIYARRYSLGVDPTRTR